MSPRCMLVGLAFAALTCWSAPAFADNEGLTDLDQATELQLEVRRLGDVEKVIALCESAMKKGLDEQNTRIAKELLVGALWQHGSQIAQSTIFGRQPHPRWPAYRKVVLDDMTKLLEHDPQFAHAHLMVARLERLPEGDEARARKAIDRAIELFGDDDTNRSLALLERAEQQQDPARRLEDLNRAIEADPANVAAWQARAQHYLTQGQLSEAVQDFERLLEKDGDNVQLHQTAADALMSLEKPELAAKHIARAMELAPNSHINYLLRARIRFAEGKLKEARADADRALEIQPGFPRGILIRSLIAAADGRMHDAIRDMQRIVRQDPTNTGLQLQLARYYVVDQRPRKAIELLTSIIEREEENWEAMRSRGDALLSIGKHAEAIQDYEVALKLQPQDDGLLNNLAWVLATSPTDELRDGQRSIELAKKACELTDYKRAHILSTLAAGYAETGDFEEAIKWAEKAVELGRESLQDQIEQLQGELESYKQGKPWRELQEIKEKPDPPKKVIET